ncbi:alpha/beta hydrolase family protein [Streptococcus pluranimalium]|uniref:DUF2974 domain-containing protein n=1 Tax=Streptococcus pluranimalium TaxID=82348 RepID=A0A2L0D3A2_9STRE|nr:hypothetical protein [Streptococcus pluranimalium]AUW96285.1 hypothetical protein C0J00_03710 [Streptococcus pluranimalium]
MKNSNISTLDASNWTYEFEKLVIDKPKTINKLSAVELRVGSKLPTHLEYLDSTYDNKTGTSGTAFLDKNTGEVIIAYTGTNKDGNAVQDIVGADLGGIAIGLGVHYQPAFDFYETIRGRYGDNITLTGHSLGGNVAQRVALEYNVDNTVVYNSAPLYVNQTYGFKERLYDWVTPGESNVERIDQQRETFTGQVTRITTKWDQLNLLTGPFRDVHLGEEYILKNSGGHGLNDIVKDKGQLTQVQKILKQRGLGTVTTVEKKQAKTLETVKTSLANLRKLKKQFSASGGGLSSNEQLYLEKEQALILASGIHAAAVTGREDIASLAEKAVKKAEDLYAKTNHIPAMVTELSLDEVKAVYAEAGVTENSIVGKTKTHFEKKVKKADNFVEPFETLKTNIGLTVDELVASDSTLAGEIGHAG